MTRRIEGIETLALSLLFSIAFIELPAIVLEPYITFSSTELIIALFLLIGVVGYRGQLLRSNKVSWGLFAVLVSMLLTTIIVPDARWASLKFVFRFSGGILLFLALKASFEEKRKVLIALKALVTASVFFAVIGLWQHFFPDSLDPILSLLVKNKFAPFDPSSPLSYTTGIYGNGTTFVVRASSVFGYCNTYAYYLVVVIGAAALLAVLENDRYWRQLAAFSVILNAWALWLTYSRGAWLSLALAVAVGTCCWFWKSPRAKLNKIVIGSAMIVLALGVVLMVIQIRGVSGDESSAHISDNRENSVIGDGSAYELDTFTARVQLWHAAWSLWKTALFFGIGVDRFRYSYFDHLPKSNYDLVVGQGLYQPHNLFLTALSWQGLVGLIALLFFILAVFCQCVDLLKSGSDLSAPLLIGLVSVLATANLYDAMMFDSYVHMILIAMILALLTAEGWRSE